MTDACKYMHHVISLDTIEIIDVSMEGPYNYIIIKSFGFLYRLNGTAENWEYWDKVELVNVQYECRTL